MFEKSRPHKRQVNFFACCGLGRLISCSSIVFVDDGDNEDDLSICWCCWASKAAWCGFDTIAINAPVVGSINGGVVAAVDDVGKANDLYAEPNDRLVKSLLRPSIPVAKRPARWCLGKWGLKSRLGENFSIGWDIGESEKEVLRLQIWIYSCIITWLSRVIEQWRLK